MKVSFTGYSSQLKTLWRRGYLPNVTKGLYGETLTQANVSVEHLLPISQGGQNIMSNTALASSYMNNLRGVRPLNEVLTEAQAKEWVCQFAPYNFMKQYIISVLKTFERLGVL